VTLNSIRLAFRGVCAGGRKMLEIRDGRRKRIARR
jgi:hypothetical protein